MRPVAPLITLTAPPLGRRNSRTVSLIGFAGGILTTVIAVAPAVSRLEAAEGLYLTWGNCALASSSSSNSSFTCDTNTGAETLYVAFTLAAPLDSVVALEIVIDVQHGDATLPPWWLFAPSQCHYGALVANADFSGESDCRDFWNGEAGVVSPPAFYQGLPGGAASQAHVVITLGVPSISPRNLASNEMYYAAKLILRNEATVGAQACDGCLAGACLVLNSIRVGRLTGGSGSESVVLEVPGAGDANRATWQGGADAACAAVPVRNVTWGGLKALYR